MRNAYVLKGETIRDFGCGELHTIASAGFASLHYYVRPADHPHRSIEHAYPSHSIVFTDVGEWQYHGAEKPSLITGDVVVTGIGKGRYACAHPAGSVNRCFIVAVDDEAFEGENGALFPSPAIRLTPDMRVQRRAIVRALADGAESERIESLAFSLYETASRACSKQTRVATTDVRMSYAKKLIRDRCSDRVSIAEIARELDLSRFTFTRRFLAATGTAPHEFMTHTRIERAKEQLRRTRRAIEDIGLTNGFGSIAHFSRAFRAIVGCTPTAYRSIAASSAVSNTDG